METVKTRRGQKFHLQKHKMIGANKIYYASKEELRQLFSRITPFRDMELTANDGVYTFDAFISVSGALSVGCKSFSRDETRKIKRWAKS